MKNILLMSFALMFSMGLRAQSELIQSKKMEVAVWDTYVKRKDGRVMHFDIIAPKSVVDTNVIYAYGREYLAAKGQTGQPLTSKECRFCHVRQVRPVWAADIKKKGYFILEMENCD